MSSQKKSVALSRNGLLGSTPPVRSHEAPKSELPAWKYLGIVAAPSDCMPQAEETCRLQPLRRWENETWTPIQWSVPATFPVWRNAPADARPGTLWTFCLETDAGQTEKFPAAEDEPYQTEGSLNVRASEPPLQVWQVIKQSAFQGKPEARSAKPRTKIAMSPMNAIPSRVLHGEENSIDGVAPDEMLLCIEDVEAVRVRYVERGETAAPFGPILALVRDKLLIGPFDLSQGSEGLWRAAPQHMLIRVRPASKRLVTLSVNGVSCSIYEPGAPLPEAVAMADFRSDSEAFAGALDALCSEAGDAPLLDANERQALQKVLSLPHPATAPIELAYRRRRFQSALQKIHDSDEAAQQWNRYVLATPEAQRIIVSAAESAKAEIVLQMDVPLQEALQRLESVEHKYELEIAKLSEAERQLRETEAKIAHAESQLAVASDTRIAEIAGQVAERVAGRVLDLAGGLERARPTGQKTMAMDGSTPAIIGQWRAAQAEETFSVTEALGRLRKRVRELGLTDECAVTLVAAWLADLTPVVVGDGSAALAQAAADCLAAGRFLTVPVTTDMISVTDLFGSVHSMTRSYAPHPSGLADVLIDTGAGGIGAGAGVIAFAGVNLADSASAFLPLMQAYRSAWAGGNAALPLAHPAVILETDPYESLCRAVWPRNLFPCFLYADGGSPLPPPPAFWRNAALVVTVPVREAAPTMVGRFSAPVPVWDEARQAVRAAVRAEPCLESASLADWRFQKALASLGVAESELLRLNALCRRLPLALSSGGTLTERDEAVLQSCSVAAYARAALGAGAW